MADLIVLSIVGIVLVSHAPLVHGEARARLDNAEHLRIDGLAIGSWEVKI